MTLEQQRRIDQEKRAQLQAQQQNTQRMMQQQNANLQANMQAQQQAQQQIQQPMQQAAPAQNPNMPDMQQKYLNQLQDLQRQLAESNSYQRNQQQNYTNQLQNLQNRLSESDKNQKSLQEQLQAAQAQQQQVLSAQETLQNLQNNKPQGYSSKYGPQIEALIQQIQKPRKFKWDFNGDELFKSYADQYTQNGRQASMDAMGQAAALTGGYGNSYAQQVGNQAYDEYLRALYDKGMELRDRAYDQWQNEGQEQYNQLGVLQNADQADYNRYRDEVSEWMDQRDYDRGVLESDRAYDRNVLESDRAYDRGVLESDRAYDRNVLESDRAFDEQVRQADLDEAYRRDTLNWQKETDQRDFDYNKEIDERNFNYSKEVDERNFNEEQRQFNESLDWDKLSTEQKYAAEYAMSILGNGQMPSEELLKAAGLSAEDAQKLMAQIAAGGGGTGGGKNKTVYVDKNGLFYTYDS